ncbi:hypothetical protein Tco_1168344 [Tanacetum coccineum]
MMRIVGQQRVVPVADAVICEPLGLGYGALRRRESAVKEDQVHSTFEVGQGSRSVPEPEGPERVSTFSKPTLTTWIDLEDGRTYIDVPAYVPPELPVQTPPSPEWSFGLLLVSPAPSTGPSPIPSPLISLTIPSPIASPVATPTATISVDEDQFLERYRFRSLEREQEKTAMTFRALWMPALALEAWVWHVETRMADMSRAWYDDHRRIHDILVQQSAL